MRHLLSVHLSVQGTRKHSSLEKKSTRKNHMSATVQLRVMKFGQNIDVDDPKEDLERQSHRSVVKVTRSNIISVILEDQGHMGQGQKGHGSRSKVDLKCQGHQVENVISCLQQCSVHVSLICQECNMLNTIFGRYLLSNVPL